MGVMSLGLAVFRMADPSATYACRCKCFRIVIVDFSSC